MNKNLKLKRCHHVIVFSLPPGPTMNGQTSPHLEGIAARRMKAVFDYDPTKDSPNDNVDEELTFQEGDVLVIYGRKDEDGFYQVSWMLAGSHGPGSSCSLLLSSLHPSLTPG